jgi:hypothetical protein
MGAICLSTRALFAKPARADNELVAWHQSLMCNCRTIILLAIKNESQQGEVWRVWDQEEAMPQISTDIQHPRRSAHARLAVRDWLETQSRMIAYWRDVLVSAGECDDLVAILDEHADVLLMAALQGDGENPVHQ